MKKITLKTGLIIKKDSNDNIVEIKNDKTLSICNKPMIEFEIDREYKKQINKQLLNIF